MPTPLQSSLRMRCATCRHSKSFHGREGGACKANGCRGEVGQCMQYVAPVEAEATATKE